MKERFVPFALDATASPASPATSEMTYEQLTEKLLKSCEEEEKRTTDKLRSLELTSKERKLPRRISRKEARAALNVYKPL